MDQITKLAKKFDKLYPKSSAVAVGMKIDGWNNLIVKLKGGSTILYDDCTGSCRLLPVGKDGYLSEDDFKREFGKRLSSIMKKLHVKQKTLSEAAGINPVSLNHYVHGRAVPTSYAVYKLAKVLGCSVEDLLYLGGE